MCIKIQPFTNLEDELDLSIGERLAATAVDLYE
jgi:hypothetical protein